MQKIQASENYLINGYYYGCYAMVSIETKTSHCESPSKIFEFLMRCISTVYIFLSFVISPFLSFDFWSLCLWIFMALVYAPLIQSKCIRVFFAFIDALRIARAFIHISYSQRFLGISTKWILFWINPHS